MDNKYTVYIGGNYLGRNNTNIGTPAPSSSHKPAIVGICKKQNTVQTCSDSANRQRLGVSAVPDRARLRSQKPDVNAQQVYTYGTANPAVGAPTVNWNAPTCSTGSFTFDNNTTMDASLPTTMLFSGSNFNCTVKDSAGNLVGSLAWDNPTKTLTIDGTIFIDGDINMPSGTLNYNGNGTIYINGSLNGGGNFSGTSICGPAFTPLVASGYGCPGKWNYPTTDPPAAGTGSLEFVFINPNNVTTPSTSRAAAMSGMSPSSSSRASPATAAPPSSARSSPTAAACQATSASTSPPTPQRRPGHEVVPSTQAPGASPRQLETAQVTRARSRRFS